MIIVKITTGNDFPFLRQLPTDNPMFKDIRFVLNEDIDECDFWIIYDNMLKPESVFCSPEHIFFFAGEPSTVRTYNRKYTNQFAKVITHQKYLIHIRKIYSHTCLPWLVGIKFDKENHKFSTTNFWSYYDFKSTIFNDKKKLISVITSNKAFTKGHKKRLEFVYNLKAILGEQLEIFGSGFNDIPDKMDALKDFKYSLVIENSQHKDYWTEKLADAFLCNCYPIYYGCSNIFDYFNQDSLTVIDITKSQDAINTILSVIDNNFYEKNLNAVLASKTRILTDYNFFYFIVSLVKNSISKEKKMITLFPEKTNIIDKVKTRIFRKL